MGREKIERVFYISKEKNEKKRNNFIFLGLLGTAGGVFSFMINSFYVLDISKPELKNKLMVIAPLILAYTSSLLSIINLNKHEKERKHCTENYITRIYDDSRNRDQRIHKLTNAFERILEKYKRDYYYRLENRNINKRFLRRVILN